MDLTTIIVAVIAILGPCFLLALMILLFSLQEESNSSTFYGRTCERSQTEGCVDCNCDGTCPSYDKT